MKLPKRKAIRLPYYDYSQNGYYFVTVCTYKRQNLFWKKSQITVGADVIRPQLTECGKYAETAIKATEKYYPNIKIDKYVIMLNHIHMILIITTNEKNGSGRIISAPTVMTVVGQMKRRVSKKAGFSVWQKSYYEHIIRNEEDYLKTVEYVTNNPLKKELFRNQ